MNYKDVESQQINNLEEYSSKYIELYEILTKDKSQISLKKGYSFMLQNKELFLSTDLITIKTLFINEGNKLFKSVIKLLNNIDFILYIEAIKSELLKNIKNQEKIEISKLLKNNSEKVEKILQDTINEKNRLTQKNIKINKSLQKIIEQTNILLDEKNEITQILELYGIKDFNGLLEYFNETHRTIKSHNALYSFFISLEKKGILMPVNNGKWQINPTIKVPKQKIIKDVISNSTESSKSPIIRKPIVETYDFKPLGAKKKITYNDYAELQEELDKLKQKYEQLEKLNNQQNIQISETQNNIQINQDNVSEIKLNNPEGKTIIEEMHQEEPRSSGVSYNHGDHAYKKK